MAPAETAEPSPARPARRAPAGKADPDLPQAEGLDAADGLVRLAGNRALYLKLLTQFVEQQAGAADEIRDLLVQGDADAAGRVAHSLKGLAGNLGATAVHATATEVERAIRAQADPADIEQLWADLDHALSGLIKELKPVLRPPPPKSAAAAEAAPPALDPAQFRKAARELWPLLADLDPGAADCLAAHRDTLRAAFAAEAFTELEQHVAAYEFAPAQELLKKAAKKHGVAL